MRLGRKKKVVQEDPQEDMVEAKEENPQDPYEDTPTPPPIGAAQQQRHPLAIAIEKYNRDYADLQFPSSTDSLLFAILQELKAISKSMQDD